MLCYVSSNAGLEQEFSAVVVVVVREIFWGKIEEEWGLGKNLLGFVTIHTPKDWLRISFLLNFLFPLVADLFRI